MLMLKVNAARGSTVTMTRSSTQRLSSGNRADAKKDGSEGDGARETATLCGFKTDPDGDEVCARCHALTEPISVQTGAGPRPRELEECSSVVGLYVRFSQPSNWGAPPKAMYCELCGCDGIPGIPKPKHIRKLVKKSLFEPEVLRSAGRSIRGAKFWEFGCRLPDCLLKFLVDFRCKPQPGQGARSTGGSAQVRLRGEPCRRKTRPRSKSCASASKLWIQTNG